MKSYLKATLLSTLLASAAAPFFGGCAATATRESTGEYVDDSTLTTKVKAAFVQDEVVKARAISVETFKGVVQLGGFVATTDEKARAEQIAANIPGVRKVQNNIAIK